MESYENVRQWMHEIDRFASEGVHKLLIGNKSDLSHERAVPYEEAEVRYTSIYSLLHI